MRFRWVGTRAAATLCRMSFSQRSLSFQFCSSQSTRSENSPRCGLRSPHWRCSPQARARVNPRPYSARRCKTESPPTVYGFDVLTPTLLSEAGAGFLTHHLIWMVTNPCPNPPLSPTCIKHMMSKTRSDLCALRALKCYASPAC